MAFTYGFYNSSSGDRKYTAEQVSQIFDGIINDGIYVTIGNALAVQPATGMNIKVCSGRAWFNHTWSYNSTDYLLTIATPDLTYSRYDAVVLEVNAGSSTRENSLKIVQGTASSSPSYPTMISTTEVHQYALAYVLVAPGTTTITTGMITNNRGTSAVPFVTGLLSVVSADDIFAQWNSEFTSWLANLRNELDSNQAAHLQAQIDDLAVLTGTSDPSSTTVGSIGQVYVNTTTKGTFRCLAISSSYYTWSPIGPGEIASDPKMTMMGIKGALVRNTTTNELWECYGRSSDLSGTATLPSSADWVAMTYGGDKFVAIAASSSKAAWSLDGKTWISAALPSSGSWTSVAYGNGYFAAVQSGSSSAAYSSDGMTWTASTLPSSTTWNAVAYGNSRFVALVYQSSTFAYSSNGISWTSATMPTGSWTSVTYGNGKFVAVSANSTTAAYSEDGITWETATLPSIANWKSVTYGNGKFVVIANGSSAAAYSVNGITWVASTLPAVRSWYSITYGNDEFAALSNASIAYSSDGITWVETSPLSAAYWDAIAYGNGKFASVASSSASAAYFTHGDYIWYRHYTDSVGDFRLSRKSSIDDRYVVPNSASFYAYDYPDSEVYRTGPTTWKNYMTGKFGCNWGCGYGTQTTSYYAAGCPRYVNGKLFIFRAYQYGSGARASDRNAAAGVMTYLLKDISSISDVNFADFTEITTNITHADGFPTEYSNVVYVDGVYYVVAVTRYYNSSSENTIYNERVYYTSDPASGNWTTGQDITSSNINLDSWYQLRYHNGYFIYSQLWNSSYSWYTTDPRTVAWTSSTGFPITYANNQFVRTSGQTVYWGDTPSSMTNSQTTSGMYGAYCWYKDGMYYCYGGTSSDSYYYHVWETSALNVPFTKKKSIGYYYYPRWTYADDPTTPIVIYSYDSAYRNYILTKDGVAELYASPSFYHEGSTWTDGSLYGSYGDFRVGTFPFKVGDWYVSYFVTSMQSSASNNGYIRISKDSVSDTYTFPSTPTSVGTGNYWFLRAKK